MNRKVRVTCIYIKLDDSYYNRCSGLHRALVVASSVDGHLYFWCTIATLIFLFYFARLICSVYIYIYIYILYTNIFDIICRLIAIYFSHFILKNVWLLHQCQDVYLFTMCYLPVQGENCSCSNAISGIITPLNMSTMLGMKERCIHASLTLCR